MKVTAFNGSPRRKGNTARLIGVVFEELEAAGIETELVSLAGHPVRGCVACYECRRKKDRRCSVTNDLINDCIGRMVVSDGILLASPTYFADVTAEMKALIDRAGFVARGNDHMLARKVGAAVVAVRRAGAIHAYDTINHFFGISQMIVPGSSYWNLGMGGAPGEVEGDAEGVETMRTLGRNMAWLLKKIRV